MLSYTTLWFVINYNIAYIFQIAAIFLTFIFHNVVYRHIKGVVENINIGLLQIYHWDSDSERILKIG